LRNYLSGVTHKLQPAILPAPEVVLLTDMTTDTLQKCPACATENPEQAKFCINCGNSLKESGSGVAAEPDEIGRVIPGEELVFEVEGVSYDPGTIVSERYSVERELGRGGMGTVPLCRDKYSDNELCCLKVINPQLIDNEDLVERF
jgi:hypothetical protein